MFYENYTFQEIIDKYNLSSDFASGVYKVDAQGYFKSVCKDLSNYFIYVGIALVTLYIIESLFSFYFFNFGFKKVGGGWGVWLRKPLNRANAWLWVDRRIKWAFAVYIIINVWMNLI